MVGDCSQNDDHMPGESLNFMRASKKPYACSKPSRSCFCVEICVVKCSPSRV